MSTKKNVASKAAEKSVNPVPEEVVQPDLTAEETAQEEPKAEVNKKVAAEAQSDEDSFCTVQMCRVAFCGSLNLRKGPGRNALVLQVLPAGTQIQIEPLEWVTDGTGVWYPATVDGVTGFVNGQYLAPIEV